MTRACVRAHVLSSDRHSSSAGAHHVVTCECSVLLHRRDDAGILGVWAADGRPGNHRPLFWLHEICELCVRRSVMEAWCASSHRNHTATLSAAIVRVRVRAPVIQN